MLAAVRQFARGDMLPRTVDLLLTAKDLAESLARLDLAVTIFRDDRMGLWEGLTHFRIVQVHLSMGQPAEAASYAEKALAQLRGIGGDWHRGSVLTVLGRALDELGQADRSRACLSEARDLQESGSTQAPQG